MVAANGIQKLVAYEREHDQDAVSVSFTARLSGCVMLREQRQKA